MPPKEYSFQVKGILIKEKDKSEDDFSIFITAMDDNHAVMLVREHLRKHAPKGDSIIKGIEKNQINIEVGGRVAICRLPF